MEQTRAKIIKEQNAVIVVLLGIIFALGLYGSVSWLESTRYKKLMTCDTVGSYEDAQEALKDGWSNLDRNKDGKACTSLQ